MNKYVILAESGSDLSPELIEKYNIKIVQMHVEVAEVDYLDNEISKEDLVAYYNETKKVPKTAGSGPFQFEQAYAEIKEENSSAIILHLAYSAQLTVSYQSSIIADDMGMKIYHIDTKQVSAGQGFVVVKVAELIEREPDIEPEDLIKKIEAIIEKSKFNFVPGNLDFLKAGGRVSNAQYLGAKLLGIRPLIELLDGLMISTKKYRGTKKEILCKMVDYFFVNYDIDKELVFMGNTVFIEEDIKEELIENVSSRGVKNIYFIEAGTVITSHAGPGGFGISGMEVLSI